MFSRRYIAPFCLLMVFAGTVATADDTQQMSDSFKSFTSKFIEVVKADPEWAMVADIKCDIKKTDRKSDPIVGVLEFDGAMDKEAYAGGVYDHWSVRFAYANGKWSAVSGTKDVYLNGDLKLTQCITEEAKGMARKAQEK